MLGRLIVALLIIGAAAIVTMERETAVAADMSADLAESKYSDAEERAKKWEERATQAEAKLAELEVKAAWLEKDNAEQHRLRELALLPLEVKTKNLSMKGKLTREDLKHQLQVSETDIARCFARATARGPELTVRWLIMEDGRVASVGYDDPPAGFEKVAVCLSEEVSDWRFPAGKGNLSFAQATWHTAAPDVQHIQHIQHQQ